MSSDILVEIYKVKVNFPSIFKMQEIMKVSRVVLSAIDKAIIIVKQMNDDIKQCI